MEAHPELTKKWVPQILVNEPSLFGFADVDVKYKEGRQPHAGRLDLLLLEPESATGYEVGLQLGRSDEEITARFLDVISPSTASSRPSQSRRPPSASTTKKSRWSDLAGWPPTRSCSLGGWL